MIPSLSFNNPRSQYSSHREQYGNTKHPSHKGCSRSSRYAQRFHKKLHWRIDPAYFLKNAETRR
jgi:hypothetical protein